MAMFLVAPELAMLVLIPVPEAVGVSETVTGTMAEF